MGPLIFAFCANRAPFELLFVIICTMWSCEEARGLELISFVSSPPDFNTITWEDVKDFVPDNIVADECDASNMLEISFPEKHQVVFNNTIAVCLDDNCQSSYFSGFEGSEFKLPFSTEPTLEMKTRAASLFRKHQITFERALERYPPEIIRTAYSLVLREGYPFIGSYLSTARATRVWTNPGVQHFYIEVKLRNYPQEVSVFVRSSGGREILEDPSRRENFLLYATSVGIKQYRAMWGECVVTGYRPPV